jgi:hypothetical protein
MIARALAEKTATSPVIEKYAATAAIDIALRNNTVINI